MNNEIEGHWRHATTNAEISYLSMLSAGASPQVARSVLPACTATEIVMTANFREWRTVLRQRTAMAAHPDMRIVARMILAWFRANFPVIVEDIQA
jgi:thymidylate synthase (FAD)